MEEKYVVECTKKCGYAFRGILPRNSWFLPIIIALIFSMLISWLIILGIKHSYSRNRRNETFSYEKNSKLILPNKKDIYLRSDTECVKITHNDVDDKQ